MWDTFCETFYLLSNNKAVNLSGIRLSKLSSYYGSCKLSMCVQIKLAT